jgi:hypothetical protein
MAREQLPAVIEQPADRKPMPALVQDAGGAGSFVWEEGRKGRKDRRCWGERTGRKDRRCWGERTGDVGAKGPAMLHHFGR